MTTIKNPTERTPAPQGTLPCPFCANDKLHIYNDGQMILRVVCEQCSASAGHRFNWKLDFTTEAAVKGWNRRDLKR